MKASREITRGINSIEECLKQLLEPEPEAKYIQLQDKTGNTIWLILTRGDGVIYLMPDKGGKTKVKSNAGDVTVLGTPDEIKALME